eukprot:CAMPEP_0196662340 /NCGR_PEP_ID=MMETSP1086-20130531/48270_1 /TAXON_ID=77921 /ORGANISM="Cyanoptyche  gloeocystis , Strain SAG4.97" /LENGTH=165 /DNA_ID=CAMNT_0041997671 /DNA_START=207 /DNA_END=704 /DNA_ORIENTATION=-
MRLELQHHADYRRCLSSLAIKEMKSILIRRNVDTRGFLERQEYTKAIVESEYYKKDPPNRSKWKASYFSTEHDSRRTCITKEELCSITWTFSFREHPMGPGLQATRANFHPDFTYTSEMFDRPLNWQFYGPDNLIQVEQYPPLSASRTPNWGWELTNPYVVFKSP